MRDGSKHRDALHGPPHHADSMGSEDTASCHTQGTWWADPSASWSWDTLSMLHAALDRSNSLAVTEEGHMRIMAMGERTSAVILKGER